jgi:DNA-3-methyladenine glycosylase II
VSESEHAAFSLRTALSRWESEGGAGEAESDPSRETFSIHPLPPFRLDLTVWALRRRARNAIDQWDGEAYRRAFAFTHTPVAVSISRAGRRKGPHLAVVSDPGRAGATVEGELRANLDRMLGLQLDLSDFYRMTADDDLIAPLVARFRGVRPPRFPSVFEGLVNAVACQQLSLEAGISLLNRLSTAHGQTASIDGFQLHSFPCPDDLAGLTPEVLRRLGFSVRKAATIIEISQAIVSGGLDLEGLTSVADDEAVARLTKLRGIGRWSAEYVLLRSIGRLHVFPGDDVGARNKLSRWLGLRSALDYDAVAHAVARWQPYAGMVYFHLLLEGLSAAGELDHDRGSGR